MITTRSITKVYAKVINGQKVDGIEVLEYDKVKGVSFKDQGVDIIRFRESIFIPYRNLQSIQRIYDREE